MPILKYLVPSYYVLTTAEASSNLARYDGIKYGFSERVKTNNWEELVQKTRSKGFGPEVKRRILMGTYVLSSGYYDAYYKKAQQVRRLIKNDFGNAFKEVDVILTPTSPSQAFEFDSKGKQDPTELYLEDLYTISANLAGLPALSMPNGSINGLPVGIQLIGNYLEEEKILKLGHHFQKETDHHLKKPNLEGFA